MIISTNVVPRLVQLLEHSQLAISVACLRTIGNLLTGTDEETQVALDSGVLDALNRLLTHNKKSVRKEVCWSVSNVTAGNEAQIQCCLNNGLIDKLIYILNHDDPDVRKEAIWGLSNSTSSASDDQIFTLAQRGIIQALGQVLSFPEARILMVSMEALDNVLKVGQKNLNANGENPFALIVEQSGMIDKIEQLQVHKNHLVYEKTLAFLESYFNTDEENDIVGLIQDSTQGNTQSTVSDF